MTADVADDGEIVGDDSLHLRDDRIELVADGRLTRLDPGELVAKAAQWKKRITG